MQAVAQCALAAKAYPAGHHGRSRRGKSTALGLRLVSCFGTGQTAGVVTAPSQQSQIGNRHYLNAGQQLPTYFYSPETLLEHVLIDSVVGG